MELRKLDDLDPLEELALIDMSYSRLDMYSTCPAKYFYTYVLKEDRVFGPAASLGSIVHSVLEDAVGEPLDLEHMIGLLDVYRPEHDPEGLIEPDLWAVGKQVLTDYYDLHVDEKYDIIGKELSFELLVGSAKIRGFIDLVTKFDDRIVVTDYKTGKYEVAAKHIPQNLQLGIYALAVAQDYPGIPIYAELYYLRSGKKKGHLFLPEHIEEVHQRVLEQVKTMINDQNFTYTDNPRPCMYCDFAVNKVCKVGATRLRNKKW